MIRRISDLLAGVPMTVVGGVFLVLSLALRLAGIGAPIDPAWVSVVVCGLPLLYLALSRIVTGKGMKKIFSALLISIAMFAAIAIGDIFAAGEVAFIMAIGAILEDKTAERAKKGLRQLISLAPAQGRRIVDGREELLPAAQIAKGDRLRILPGEAVPVDGVILSGSSSLDQSVITGESLPVDKAPGDAVFCGTLNRFGAIDIEATKVGEDSSLQRLIRLVQQAGNNKAPMERIADRWATWLVPLALLIAVVAGLATRDIVRAVTVLVVFCPCALVLATPTAVMAAIGQATKYGVIIKSGAALERMGGVDCLAFDKTGTLTQGAPVVCDVTPFGGVERDALLRAVASVEAMSEHPLARAVVAYAMQEGIEAGPAAGFEMLPGKGVRGLVDGAPVLCGNQRWLAGEGVHFDEEALGVLAGLEAQGKAVMIAAKEATPARGGAPTEGSVPTEGGAPLGVVALADTLRPDAPAMVRALKGAGAETVLLTGDNARAARYFAQQAGIGAVCAGLLPEQKVENIARLQAKGKTVCMVGDGINDAPALKAADVGVAMGAMGSDISVEAADIALVGDDIGKLPYLKRLANATVKTIKLSIALSLLINFIAILLSVAGVLTSTTGALVHNAGSIFVVLIAALLYDRNFFKNHSQPESAAQDGIPAAG